MHEYIGYVFSASPTPLHRKQLAFWVYDGKRCIEFKVCHNCHGQELGFFNFYFALYFVKKNLILRILLECSNWEIYFVYVFAVGWMKGSAS